MKGATFSSHHLVMFDLPLDPELLEQRIGRLDRIGQRARSGACAVCGASAEVLARWYQEGLNSFEKISRAGARCSKQFGARVHDLAQDFHETETTARPELKQLFDETCAARQELTMRLEQGRDRLLELNSFRPEANKSLCR